MEVNCPICWEKVPQAMCLPCGHAICNDDFWKLGGEAPRPSRTHSAPASARRALRAREGPVDETAAEAYHTAAGLSFFAAAVSTMSTLQGSGSLLLPTIATVATGLGGVVATGMLEDNGHELQAASTFDQKPNVVMSLTMAAASTGAAASLNAVAAAKTASSTASIATLAASLAAETTGTMACLTGAAAAAKAQAAAATATAAVAAATATVATASASVIVPASAAVVGWGIYKLASR